MAFLRRRRRAAEPGDAPARIDVGVATDTGPRPDNQDRAVVSPGWAIVSDGVGGHAGGGLAAELTVEAVVATLSQAAGPGTGAGAGGAGEAPGGMGEEVVRLAVEAANDAVRAGRREDPAVADMGATLTIAVAMSVEPAESRWLVANVGDSPAWRVTARGTDRLTQDHTLAAELVRSGAITEADAARHPGRNVVVRSIGGEDTVTPDVTSVGLRSGEALVLASDGVSDQLDAARIHEVVTQADTATDAARLLVDAALRRGATDNVTTTVVRHVALSPGASAEPEPEPQPEQDRGPAQAGDPPAAP